MGNDGADQLNGNGGDDDLRGGAGSDALNGGNGADRLNGGTGTDAMNGGSGNDIYIVDDAGDVLVEGAGGGLDSIFTSVGWTLAAEFERLGVSDFATTYAIDLTGNGVANEMWGNAGANVLDGAGGADLMYGFGGDDTYRVDNAGDIVIELPGEGIDTITTTVSYTIAHDIEKLLVADPASTGAINLTGNESANEITGNAGANLIDGGSGADTMTGLGGNDIYIVDNANDTIVEASNGGLDTVFTSVGMTLGNDVERLGVNGFYTTFAIDLTGNALDNEMWGNDGVNVLDGRRAATSSTASPVPTPSASPPRSGQPISINWSTSPPAPTRWRSTTRVHRPHHRRARRRRVPHRQFRAGCRRPIIYDNLTGSSISTRMARQRRRVQFAVVHEGISLAASDFTVIWQRTGGGTEGGGDGGIRTLDTVSRMTL